MSYLNVDEDAVVRLVQHFAALCVQGELEGDLSLACWDFSCLGHLDVAADQLDGLRGREGGEETKFTDHDAETFKTSVTPSGREGDMRTPANYKDYVRAFTPECSFVNLFYSYQF